jgi:hypothetical protein
MPYFAISATLVVEAADASTAIERVEVVLIALSPAEAPVQVDATDIGTPIISDGDILIEPPQSTEE